MYSTIEMRQLKLFTRLNNLRNVYFEVDYCSYNNNKIGFFINIMYTVD